MATVLASALLHAVLTAMPAVGAHLETPRLALGLEATAAAGPGSLALDPPAFGDVAAMPPPADPGAQGDAARARRLRFWGTTLRWSTAAALVATSTLGTMAALNQPTAFGDGRCLTGDPVLGEYGCNRGLSTLHGASAVLSVTLYTANGVLALAAPESRGVVAEPVRPLYHVLSWVHLVGIVLQPAMGLVAAFPQVIGKATTAPTDPFPRNLRTAHVFVGYVTTAAFLTTAILER